MYTYTHTYAHVHTHRFFVLDEADEMLNVGFKDSVDKLFEAVNETTSARGYHVQTLLFSATVPGMHVCNREWCVCFLCMYVYMYVYIYMYVCMLL